MEKLKPENASLDRIQIAKLKDYLMEVFNIEKGWLYTFWELTVRPGYVLNNYLFHDRSKLVKPVGFLLLSVAVSTFLSLNFLDLESSFSSGVQAGAAGDVSQLPDKFQEAAAYSTQKYLEYFNLIVLFSIPFMALSSLITFKKFKYYYSEHLVINMYLGAFLTFCYVFLFPLNALLSYSIFGLIYMVLWVVYMAFAYTKVFQCKVSTGIGRSLLAFLLFMIFYILVIVIFQSLAVAYYLSTHAGS